MINAAIFASGKGTNAENLFKYFENDARIRIKMVVCNRERAGVVQRARRYRKNVQIISKASLERHTERFIEYLQVEEIGLIILAGWLLKLPESLVKAFPGRIINIHPALLPLHGGKGMFGRNVHQSVIDAGDRESGITIHYVNEEYDKGEIILQVKCPVEKGDTAETLENRVRELEFKHLPEVISDLIARLPHAGS